MIPLLSNTALLSICATEISDSKSNEGSGVKEAKKVEVFVPGTISPSPPSPQSARFNPWLT